MQVESEDYFYQSTDGLRLYCRIHAARRRGGLPVLCLPGLTRNSRDFARLAAHLSREHEVWAADLRGRGQSQWDPVSFNYQLKTYVRDIWTLVEARGAPRILIIGTSLGALIAMTMAAMQPERIAAAVLNDAGPELEAAGLRRIGTYVGKLPPVSTWAEAAAQTKRVYEHSLPGLSDEEWMDYARRGYRETSAGIPVPDMDPRIADAFRMPAVVPITLWLPYAQAKRVPMLVLRGASSDLLSAATVARMVREKPDLELVEVANRGHAPLLDEPESLQAIGTFIARYGQDTT